MELFVLFQAVGALEAGLLAWLYAMPVAMLLTMPHVRRDSRTTWGALCAAIPVLAALYVAQAVVADRRR